VEVVECERLVRLPHSPPRVLGLCTLRRELLPVIGLERDDEPGSDRATGKRLLLVLRTSRGTWAVPVAGEGTAVAQGAIDDPCPAPDTGAPWLTFLGTVRRGETVHAAIDLEATWSRVRDGVETYYAGGWFDASAAATARGRP